MGVRNLESYVRAQAPESVRVPYRWGDAAQAPPDDGKCEPVQGRPHVVVDGSSLLYRLYFDTCEWQYMGQWEKFTAAIEAYFGALVRACASVLVVLDGVTPKAKLPTILERLNDRLRVAADAWKAVAAGGRGGPGRGGVLPTLAKGIYIDVLRGLPRVEVRVCVAAEADDVICALALQRRALILSRDSDFFLCKSPGYVPLYEVDPAARHPFSHYYTRAKLCALLGLPAVGTLSLLACVLGNDFVLYDEFSRLRSKARSEAGSQRRNRGHQDIDATAQLVARVCREHRAIRPATEQLLLHNGVARDSPAWANLLGRFRAEAARYASQFGPEVLGGHADPGVPLSPGAALLRRGLIGSAVLDLSVSGLYICSVCFEDLHKPPVADTARPIRRLLYAIATTDTGEGREGREGREGGAAVVTEHFRERLRFQCRRVERSAAPEGLSLASLWRARWSPGKDVATALFCHGAAGEPGLESAAAAEGSSLHSRARRYVLDGLLPFLGGAVPAGVREGMRLACAAALFYCHAVQPSRALAMALALRVCEDAAEASQASARSARLPSLRKSDVHFFAGWTDLVATVAQLNDALLQPFPCIALARVADGALFLSLAHHLRGNPEASIGSLCHKGDPALPTLVFGLLEPYVQKEAPAGAKGPRKAKASRKASPAAPSSSGGGGLHNRFSALALDG